MDGKSRDGEKVEPGEKEKTQTSARQRRKKQNKPGKYGAKKAVMGASCGLETLVLDGTI